MLNHTPHSGGVRSIPLLRPATTVFGPTTPAPPIATWTPPPRRDDDLIHGERPALTGRALAEATLATAECARHNARLDYVRARAGIGRANRTGRPADRWTKTAVVFSAEQVRRNRSLAFRALNLARAALRQADRAVAAAVVGLAGFAH